MAYYIKDLSDIVQYVVDELKIDSNDANETARIKRDINAVYLDEVVPYKKWLWLSGHYQVEFKPYLASGTVSVTPDSTTITFSTAPSTSKTGYYFAVESFDEIYVIESHTAGATTATLSSVFTGTLNTTATYKVWKDYVALPTDLRETITVWQDFSRAPLTPKGLSDFRRLVAESPRYQARPSYYTTHDYYDPTSGTAETETDRYRVLKLYPAVYENSTTLKIDYIKEATYLSLDGDEPLMPIEDRIILVYGALARAWRRNRNPEAADTNYMLFQQKLARMAGKQEDSDDKPYFSPESNYLARKRARSSRSQGYAPFNSGGSYSAPRYLKNVVIEGGNITAAITANSGITIDGRDISADGALLDSHIADTTDAHDASAISVSPSGNLAATDVQAALTEIQTDVDTRALSADLTAHIGDTSDAHDASAISVAAGITGLAATNVQTALSEISGDVDTHLADAADAHDASAISVAAGITGLAATDVQAALSEISGDVDAHLADTTDAHDASAISFSAVGTIAATDVQTAVAEVATDAASALSTHESDTSTHGVGTIVGTTESQTLSSKTLTAPVIDVAVMDGQASTPANPAAGYYKLYFKDSNGKPYYLDSAGTETQVGSGAGGGGINHLSSNPDAETDTTGWALYEDAAGTSPVDGTGVAVSNEITWTRTTTTPQRGIGSFLLTKPASNVQGEGVSFAFTPSRADRYKVHTIRGNYEIASGTFADDAVRFYIYDVTNSAIIEPAANKLKNTSVNGEFSCSFQTTDSTSYRFCIHVAGTDATAYTIEMDDLVIEPVSRTYGPYVGDWESFTPTGSLTTNVTYTGKKRRVGDSCEFLIRLAFSGATDNSAVTINIPHTIDTNKVLGTTLQTGLFGLAQLLDGGGSHLGGVQYQTTTSVRLGGDDGTTSWLVGGSATPVSVGNGDFIECHFTVPISGWSSSQLLSDSSDTRVVGFIAKSTSAAMSGTLSGAYNKATFGTTILNDTHGGYSGGTYTVKVSGLYDIAVQAAVSATWSATNVFYLALYKNGANYAQNRLNSIAVTSDNYNSLNLKAVPLNAGDTLEVYTYVNGTTPTWSGDATTNFFSVSRVSGPAQIAASETVACVAYLSANQTGVNPNASYVKINFDTREFDSHGAWDTTNKKFTAPVSGTYLVVIALTVQGTNVLASTYTNSLYKNGAGYWYDYHVPVANTQFMSRMTKTVKLLAGETIESYLYGAGNNSASTLTVNGGSGNSYISITRVGNY